MRPRAGIATALAATLALLGGCGAPAPVLSPDPDPTPAGPLNALVYQPRGDIAAGTIVVQVTNTSDDAVELVAARVDADGFTAPAIWADGPSTLRAGATTDLRTALPPRTCSDTARATIVLGYLVGSVATEREFDADDPYGVLPRLRDEACIGEEVAAVARVTAVRVDGPDAHGIAHIVYAVEPTGSGSVTLVAVEDTTLLTPVAADGSPVPRLELGIRLDADGPRDVRVPVRPARCDPHVLAEDKVGTVIPFRVRVGDGDEVRWPLASPQQVAGALHAYVAADCGIAR